MIFKWLKRYMPRGLYSRAALILIVPIVTIQLVVSIVFIQRHYEDVTRQMTGNILLELSLIRDTIDGAETAGQAQEAVAELADPLGLGVTFPVEGLLEDQIWALDFSGRAMVERLRQDLPDVQGIDLFSNDKWVAMTILTKFGNANVEFQRVRVSASNPHQLLVLMMFLSLLMTIIAYLFLRNQLRPITRLAAASEAFGKGHTARYKPRGATEVRAAGRAFLDMRNRIETQIEQRTLMLSGVSHDLRTPLTRIKLGLSLLEDIEDVADLKGDVQDMQAMIDGFLDFARGGAEEKNELTDVVALCQSEVEKGRRFGAGNARDVKLMPIEGQVQNIQLRPIAVSRALGNLIANALRYGNRAEVKVVFSQSFVRLIVEDDGPGIPKESREAALRPFSRLEPARNQNKGSGVGLGLSIAIDIAHAHGGRLELGTSEALGGLRADLVLAI
ncbi:ATP-binding protein [Cochlodiniinecator piscidefendens]|uniref:ATP-binding protein n=1 Tax=Cochlodiniinecator piscidefendens TaxID=2715756 RepID=UPI001407951D|nr:ATP-binding protein [Cochlodiniinecator piscidefendens]